MFNPFDNINNTGPVSSQRAFKLGVGGSLILLVIWGVAIINAEPGGLMKPVGEMFVTAIVLIVSGIGCIGIALRQFVDTETRRQSFVSLFYGLLPVIVFVAAFCYLHFVMNIRFS